MSKTSRRATPRPQFVGPHLIRHEDTAHHVWGDVGSGLVTDRVVSSTDQLHVLEFELTGGTGFRHSPDNPTVFAADVAYLCLRGTLVVTDPESGEICTAPAGTGVAFGRDTWHHGFALGAQTATVLEFMAPPPSRGTASTYGRTRPLLTTSTYDDRRWERRWPEARAEQLAGRRLTPLRPEEGLLTFRDDSPAHLVRRLLDREHLRVVHGTVQPGTVDAFADLAWESVVRVVDGRLWVDVRDTDGSYWVQVLGEGDACFLPAGSAVRFLERDGHPATYLMGSGSVPDHWTP